MSAARKLFPLLEHGQPERAGARAPERTKASKLIN